MIKDSGLLYAEFNGSLNTEDFDKSKIQGFQVYCGIDFGSGGAAGHPSSIVYVAVDEDYFRAYCFHVWKSEKSGEGFVRMTQSDLLKKYEQLNKELKVSPHTYYDWSATDLGEIAIREGIGILPANKNHEHGVGVLNSLFRSQQLMLFTGFGSGHASELIQELELVNQETPKKHRKDDCCDALRYALSNCPMRITRKVSDVKNRKKEAEIKCKRMRFYKGLEQDPQASKDWSEDIDEMLDEASQLFED